MHTLGSVIATHHHPSEGALAVMSARMEVMFKDGTAVHLHPVCRDGAEDQHLRALQAEGLIWTAFDLRRVAPGLEADLSRATPRDVPGLVFYTLRQAYPSAQALHRAIDSTERVTWWRDVQAAACATERSV